MGGGSREGQGESRKGGPMPLRLYPHFTLISPASPPSALTKAHSTLPHTHPPPQCTHPRYIPPPVHPPKASAGQSPGLSSATAHRRGHRRVLEQREGLWWRFPSHPDHLQGGNRERWVEGVSVEARRDSGEEGVKLAAPPKTLRDWPATAEIRCGQGAGAAAPPSVVGRRDLRGLAKCEWPPCNHVHPSLTLTVKERDVSSAPFPSLPPLSPPPPLTID